MSLKPVIFVSAVSKELHSARDLVAKTLIGMGYEPKWQDIAPSETGDLRGVLRDWIDQSVGLIQIVGHCYGSASRESDPNIGRVSYTQYEAIYARGKGLPIWYVVLDPSHPTDACAAETPDLEEQQGKYRELVKSYGDIYHPSETLHRTENIVLKLEDKLKKLRSEWAEHRTRVEGDLSTLVNLAKGKTREQRRTDYLRSLVAGFSAYQELALDNYAAADQTCPDIWDIFVHPACSTEHLRPEDMDKAQLETPPRLPAQELLPILGSATERRHVLLADPGMGKSTLVQSLIALIASGRSIVGAPALTGLLPVPLILRDLVPLLPQAEPDGWTWDLLLEVLIQNYCREENAPALFQAWHGHEQEFRDLIHGSEQVFFLVDGLDEIGDLRKRKQIVQAIQEGIRTADKGARWLITSRVIGYDEAAIHSVYPLDGTNAEQLFAESTSKPELLRVVAQVLQKKWDEWLPYTKEDSEKRNRHTDFSDMVERATPLYMLRDVLSRDSAFAEESFKTGHLSYVASFDVSIPIANRLYLAPFDDRRQDLFTQRWFRHRHSTDYSTALMREVRQHGHEGVRVIARVPNLLCMMNMLKRSGKPLPDGRAALYDEIVKAYLGGIESTFRNREAIGLTCPLSAAELRHLLALLGAHMQKTRSKGAKGRRAGSKSEAEGTVLISQPEIEKLLTPAIQGFLDAGRIPGALNARELLQDLLRHIARRSGLLIPRSVDAEGDAVYGFTHLSFLEFFAAEWLGREFDRLQKRYARQGQAIADGETLTDADLDREFPAPQPIAHQRQSFSALAAHPSWHEPLIFLLEARSGDARTLLRWLFPELHPTRSDGFQPSKAVMAGSHHSLKPLISLEAVRLAVKLSHDKDLNLPPDLLRRWWSILWMAQLREDEAERGTSHLRDRRIPQLLLERRKSQREVLAALAEAWTELVATLPEGERPPLLFRECRTLNSYALHAVAGLVELEELDLRGCVGLEDTAALAGMGGLRSLDLSGCIGLRGSGAFQGLARLRILKQLYLMGCTGLDGTTALAELSELRVLSLSGCIGLKGSGAFSGIIGLVGLDRLDLIGCHGLVDTFALSRLKELRSLDLSHCIGLNRSDALQGLSMLAKLEYIDLRGCAGLKMQEVEALRKKQGPKCEVFWP